MTLGIGRGRQCLRRPLLHPRLRCAQRRLHRRHPRSGGQRPREFLHRADRNPARTGLVLCRPRHRRRRDQYRHQAGRRPQLLQRRDHVRHRPHQARHARRQPGDQPDALDSHRRHVPGRRRRRPQLRRRTIAGAASSRPSGRRPTTSRSRRTTSTPISAACRISACPGTGRATRRSPRPASRARIGTASSIATSRPRGRTSVRSPASQKVTDSITLTSRTRAEHSLLDYIGTLPNSPQTLLANPAAWTFTASPQSRNQWVDVSPTRTDAHVQVQHGIGQSHRRGRARGLQ